MKTSVFFWNPEIAGLKVEKYNDIVVYAWNFKLRDGSNDRFR